MSTHILVDGVTNIVKQNNHLQFYIQQSEYHAVEISAEWMPNIQIIANHGFRQFMINYEFFQTIALLTSHDENSLKEYK